MKTLFRHIARTLTATAMAAAALLFAPASRAETVTQPQAKAIASQFFNAAHGQYMAEPKMVYNGRRLTTQHLFVPFYVYNLPAGAYVIISAENKAFPILAYSLKDTFDPNHISDNLKSILRSYALDIERIRYDSRIPDQAIAAWGDLKHYIAGILDARYEATDPVYTQQETADMVDEVAENPEYDDMWSDIYSPEQWEEMIDDELAVKKSVAVGFANANRIAPVTLYGRKGDYYRMRTEVPDQALFRLFATEYLSDGQLAMLANPIGIKRIEKEEAPFTFHESFIAEQEEDAARRQRQRDEAGMVTRPILHTHGPGFYTVDIPEEAAVARIYNIGGALVRQYTYKNTMSPHIELIGEPTGFYFAQIIGRSGKPYGVKLVR